MTASPSMPIADQYNAAAIAYRFAITEAVDQTIGFITRPDAVTRAAFEQACGGYVSAQLALFDLQLARINEAVGSAQLAQILGGQMDAKLQLLEELGVENRDSLMHLRRLLATLIERLPPVLDHAARIAALEARERESSTP